jgi:hypothetical protein
MARALEESRISRARTLDDRWVDGVPDGARYRGRDAAGTGCLASNAGESRSDPPMSRVRASMRDVQTTERSATLGS